MNKTIKLPKDHEETQKIKKVIQTEIKRLKEGKESSQEQILQKIAILEQRLRLIESYRELCDPRLSNLQRIFKHYCTHVFKTGHNVNFERIVYENQHLIMERFFAIVMDFKLNEIQINGQKKPIIDRGDIILLFKKCSSNARNLQFSEFVTCIERLFIALFDGTRSYDSRQQKIKADKIARAQEVKRRQKIKLQKQKAKENGQTFQNIKKIQKEFSTKVENVEQAAANQNDSMMKDMMKNFEIVNPTEEINLAIKEISKQGQQGYSQIFDPYTVTDEQKIESYMLRIGIDNKKQIQKKLRYFEKANVKFHQAEQLEKTKEIKESDKLKLPKKQSIITKEIIESHQEWGKEKKTYQEQNAKRLISVKQKISERQMLKNKSVISKSLSNQNYDLKKKKIIQNFQRKQRDLMYPTALQRITKRKQQEQTVYFNLQMIHKSSPHQLQINKINPQRYISSDPSDHIFMQEYGYETGRSKRRGMGNLARADSQILETKRRAAEIQNQQEKRASRFTINLYKNHHYLEKFLERKW